MFLVIAALCFSVFALNVVIGSTGRMPFMGDVTEMLFLLAATVAFVAAILKREAAARK